MRLKYCLGGISRAIRTGVMERSNPGLFGNPKLTDPKSLNDLALRVQKKSHKLVDEIVENAAKKMNKSKQTTVQMVDNLSNEICSGADLVINLVVKIKNNFFYTDCVRNMHCEPKFTKAADESMRNYTFLVETLNTTPELYQALKNSLITEKDRLDDVDLRTAILLLEDFEHSGVHLNKEHRKNFVELSNIIFDTGTNFMANVDAVINLTPEECKKYGFKDSELTHPWVYSDNFQLRKFTYEKYYEHNDLQENNLKRLLIYRNALAKATGFKSYGHRAQKHSILSTYENVESFLTGLIIEINPLLEEEIEHLRRVVMDHSKNFNRDTDKIGEWDLDFATKFERKNILKQFDGVDFSEYFYLESVLKGFETLINHLYGLHFTLLWPEIGEIWPGNVLKLNVLKENQFLGTIYLDIDSRSSKVQGDCHFTVRCSKVLENGEYQSPIVVLSLSIVPPDLQNQSAEHIFESVKLSLQQTENFFHEMGHAIHSMLGRTRYQHVAGTRCPTDFAEIPSNLMECFFKDSKVLLQILKNKSGNKIPLDLAQSLISSKNVFGAIHLLKQALIALYDLKLHGPEFSEYIANDKITTSAMYRDLANKALPGLDRNLNFSYNHRITHLVTYGAKYYSYLVANSSASLIYKKLFSENPFSRENGLKWAQIQSYGGEYPSPYLLEKILGSAPTSTELTKVLCESLKTRTKKNTLE